VGASSVSGTAGSVGWIENPFRVNLSLETR
jgi:hypothetical protein